METRADSLIISSFLLLIAIQACQCFSYIEEGPQSVNATVNSTVVFTCSGTGSYPIVWRINNNLINHHLDDNYHKNGSQLRVNNVTADLNNSMVYCSRGNDISALNTSEPALILLQGYLEAPVIMNASFMGNTTLLVSWAAPNTLDNVPILGYQLSIINQVSGVSVDTHYSNTSMNGSIDSLNDKNCYEIRLTANNSLGDGETAFAYYNRTVAIPNQINYTVRGTGSTTMEVTTMLQIDISCFPLSANITLTAFPTEDSTKTETVTTIINSSEVKPIEFSALPNKVYSLTLRLYNSTTGWVLQSPYATNVSTYDVQMMERGEMDGQQCLRCLFAANSQATGCIIFVHDNDTSDIPLMYFNSPVIYNESVTEWRCYAEESNRDLLVRAYDVERYGITSNQAAIALNINQIPLISIVPMITSSKQMLSTSHNPIMTTFTHMNPVSFVTVYITTSRIITIAPSYLISTVTNGLSPTITTGGVKDEGNNNNFILIVLAVLVVLFLGGLICLIVTVVILFRKNKQQKVLLLRLQKTIVPNTYNPIYDRSNSMVTANQRAVDKLSTEIERPLNVNAGTHIYSEINLNKHEIKQNEDKRDNGQLPPPVPPPPIARNGANGNSEWVSNPSYGQTGLLLDKGVTEPEGTEGGASGGEFKIYDSPKKQALDLVPDLNPCPAYAQPPTLPARTNK